MAGDLTVTNAVTIDNANEQIITGTNDLTLTAAPVMSLGQLTSSGGTVTMLAATTITSGTFNMSGTTLALTGAGTFDMNTATVTAPTTLTIGGNTTLANEDLSITTLNLTDFALTLTATNLTVAAAVDFDNGLEQIITGANNLTLSTTFTMTLGQITSTGGTITLNGVPGGGTLDFTGSTLVLNGDLNTTAAAFTAPTNLSITSNATLTTNAATFTATTLTLNDLALTLANTTLTVTNAVTLDNANEQIITGTNNFILTAAPTFSNGAITSTAGTITFSDVAGTTISGGTFNCTGSTLSLNGDLNLSGSSFTAPTTLVLNTNPTTLTGAGTISITTLTLNDLALTLASTNLTVTNAVTIDNANEQILTGTNNLTLTAAPVMSLGQLTSSSGTVTMPAATTITSGTFDMSGTTLVLTGAGTFDMNTATVTAPTTLTIGGNTTLANEDLSITTLNLTDFALTLTATNLTVAGLVAFDNALEQIITAGNNLVLTAGFTMSDGDITSTGGNITLKGSTTGAPGTLDFTGSTLTLNGDLDASSIGGNFTAPNDLAITANAVLTLANPLSVTNLTLNDLALTMAGDLTVTNTIALDATTEQIITAGNNLTLGNTLTMSNGAITSTGGTIVLNTSNISGGTVDITGTTITQSNNISLALPAVTSDSASIWNIGAGFTLTLTGASGSISGTINIPAAATLNGSATGTAEIDANVVLNGGTFDIDEDISVTSSGNITHTAASTIDIATNKTLTYYGATLNIGAFNLTLTSAAGGAFTTTNSLTLNSVTSRLTVNGSGTINNVSFTAASNLGEGIVVNGGAVVITDLYATASPRINVAAGTLDIGNAFYVNAAVTLTVTGAGTLTFHDIVLSADLDIDGTIALANDASLIVLATATFNPGGDLTFEDGLNVATGAQLTIVDAGGTYTITIEGGVTIAGTGTVVVNGDESLVMQFPSPDSTTLAKVSGTGTISPVYVAPITNFAVASVGDQQVNLSWDASASDVLIRRSTTGYPTTTTSGTLVYDGNVTPQNDAGLTNGVTYYYSAFTHTNPTNHTDPSSAEGTPVAVVPAYDNDVTSFTATVGDGQISLSWGVAAGDFQGVKILRKTTGYPDSSTDAAATEVYNNNGTSTIDRGLSNGSGYKGLTNSTIYYYRAFAYDSGPNYSTGVNALAATAIVSSGLVAYYPFSGNAVDGSGQGYHGEIYTATLTTDMHGTSNQAYDFDPDDGDNDYIEIDNPVEDNFSISFWFQSTQNLGTTTNWYTGKGLVDAKTGADQNDFGVGLGLGKVMFGTGNPDTTITTTATFNDGEWYHAVATRTKATGSLKLYIQGAEVASGSGNTNTLGAPTVMRIASSPEYNTEFFKGKIDDVRLYNRVLNLTEIQELYFSTASKREGSITTSDNSTSNHSCLLVNVASGSNNIKCWGNAGATGILGDGSSTGSTSTPVEVSGITTAVQVSGGLNHNCAVLSDDTIKCWGEGANGKLGNGGTSNQTTPVTVSGINDAWQVSTGGEHSCAVLDNGFSGTVKCWGDASSGQLGNGTSTGSYSTPQLVTGISTAVHVEAGYDFSCALLADRTIECWGNGGNGKLGYGSTTSQNTPVTVSGVTGSVQLTLGYTHACALIYDGTIKCWGNGTTARMGDGFSNTTNSTPVPVTGISNAVQVIAGYSHTCALLDDATVKCWGVNVAGELGTGASGATQDSPVVASEFTTVSNISLGGNTTCAILSDGTAKCVGEGTLGELGDTTTTDNTTAQAVSGLNNSAKQ